MKDVRRFIQGAKTDRLLFCAELHCTMPQGKPLNLEEGGNIYWWESLSKEVWCRTCMKISGTDWDSAVASPAIDISTLMGGSVHEKDSSNLHDKQCCVCGHSIIPEEQDSCEGFEIEGAFCSESCLNEARRFKVFNKELPLLEAEKAQKPPHDSVNHPSHYTSHPSGVECREITRHYSCMIGAAIKYLWRAGLKSESPKYITSSKIRKEGVLAIRQDVDPVQIEDLNKAIFCIMDEIDKLGGEVTARPREKKE